MKKSWLIFGGSGRISATARQQIGWTQVCSTTDLRGVGEDLARNDVNF
jgi:hypothetical protein